ncbi:MAG: hypothetical protein KAI47_24080 [Deltaproteobacteria bacterium]|nr:hypothetical protein [Deltaproteobacteria bacterium]
MFRLRILISALSLVGALALTGCSSLSPEEPTGERPDLKMLGGKADVPEWLRHIPKDWGCDQTLQGHFSGWDSAHVYSFPGKLGYEYTFTFKATYAWYRGAAIAVYDAETGKRVALARRVDNHVKVVYRAERSVKYLVAAYSLWWWAEGDYTLGAACKVIAHTCTIDSQCAQDEYCKLVACGQAQEGVGSCETRPTACISASYTPVCGCDGRDYNSPCGAAQHNISVAHGGYCPALTLDPLSVPLGESVQATIENRSQNTAIFLKGCSPLGLQQKVSGVWQERGPLISCGWEGIAKEIAPLGHFADSALPSNPGTYRLYSLYAVGCDKGTPLSQANCEVTRKLLSPTFEIEKASCAGAFLDGKGNCRTPADGTYPDSCCAKELEKQCADINSKYVTATKAARGCSLIVTAPQCQYFVTSDLSCGLCTTVLNADPDRVGVTTYAKAFDKLRCHRVLVMCPKYVCQPPKGGACSPLGGSSTDGQCVPTY